MSSSAFLAFRFTVVSRLLYKAAKASFVLKASALSILLLGFAAEESFSQERRLSEREIAALGVACGGSSFSEDNLRISGAIARVLRGADAEFNSNSSRIYNYVLSEVLKSSNPQASQIYDAYVKCLVSALEKASGLGVASGGYSKPAREERAGEQSVRRDGIEYRFDNCQWQRSSVVCRYYIKLFGSREGVIVDGRIVTLIASDGSQYELDKIKIANIFEKVFDNNARLYYRGQVRAAKDVAMPIIVEFDNVSNSSIPIRLEIRTNLQNVVTFVEIM